MKKIILVILIMNLINISVYSQTKNEDITKLMDIMNYKLQAEQAFDLIMPNFIRIFPNVPAIFWKTFKEELDIQSFVNIYIPIYDKHFSHDDIKKLIEFYESPIGRKLIEVTPLITQDSFIGGQEWGKKLGEDIVKELVREGYVNNT